MTSNQALQSRGQKRRRSTTWRGVRRGVQHFPEKFPIHLERCRISLKHNHWGSTNTTIYIYISFCCPKTSLTRKFVNQTQTFFFCSLDFSLFDMFFNVSFSDVFFLTPFGTFFLALPHELRVALDQGNLGPYSFAGLLRCVKRSWIPWRSFSTGVIDMTMEN